MITEPTRFLGRPVYSLQTMLRAIARQDPRILPVIPSGIYGPNTYASVKSFQDTFSLPVNGSVDFETWQTIINRYETLPPNIVPNLYLAQAMFSALARQFPSFSPSAGSENIRYLQAISDLPVTGDLDAATYLVLQELYILTNNKSSSL